MQTAFKYTGVILIACILLILLSFSGCRWATEKFIGVQSIRAEDLKPALSTQTKPHVLDLREETAFSSGHIPGAIRLDLNDLDGYLEKSGIAHRAMIVLVCEEGWGSQIAAAVAMGWGYPNAFSLSGGMKRWKRLEYPMASGPDAVRDWLGQDPPIVEISILSQTAMTAAAFVVKPLYVILTFLIILMLWGKKSRDLILIRNAMAAFFIGENACTMNYLLASNASATLEFIHGLGMVATIFLLVWGFISFLDDRVLHYLEPERPCAFQRHCKHCWKNVDVSCGLHKLALFVVPAFAFASLIPVTMPLRPFVITMPVFLSDVLWVKDFWNLMFEFRVYPILGALCFVIAFLFLRRGKAGLKKAQLPLFCATGFVGYSFFRFGLFLTFRENQAWANWWEESTELILVVTVLLFLDVFKDQLGLRTPWPLNKINILRVKPTR
jgi:rhodanese-related sulfurtransferase